MKQSLTGAQIRQSFIDFFKERGHTFVPSASLVPGGDQTLLFTNAGMVQFKDVFLGTDVRPFKRAVDSQKCLRVAGKHNDLDDVGRDDIHQTFFEMLGNWSFGDYYKEEAIEWAWDLLTRVWGLDRNRLWCTCFKDDKGDIPPDAQAAEAWRKQPGIDLSHILFFGRKDNFWEMADTGPCGPCSEIHIDLGEERCNLKDVKGHVCSVNGDCLRFTELWNLVFIQYNRINADTLEPLPAKHVDTGMGFERVVSIIQEVYSNYRTDLLSPLMDTVQKLAGHTTEQREMDLTPYRVIADHARAAAFLIADGVVPGNTGRNYVCRMIIRRAARFGSKIGLMDTFLAKVAGTVIENYGDFYPELTKNKKAILDNLTREEIRFRHTVDAGLSNLEELLAGLKEQGARVLDGKLAFDLYATHGLPLEISRDIAREQGLDVEEKSFHLAMEEHRLLSGGGKAIGKMGGEEVETFRLIINDLIRDGKLDAKGVEYDPYGQLAFNSNILALVKDGVQMPSVNEGDLVDVILPKTGFYIESGGQIADTGKLTSNPKGRWEIQILDVRKPAAGVIIHVGEVVRGKPTVGDEVVASVDTGRRLNIMRNHTSTHLLHAELRSVLGDHARQAGSLVAPDHLRFDFTHPSAVSVEELENIENGVNRAILSNYQLAIENKSLSKAMEEGAMALFGEKYGETVRTVVIGEGKPFSYELCGGTHVKETGDIGIFLITAESSAAAGIRRIEAVTGLGAYELIQQRFKTLKQTASVLNSSLDDVPQKAQLVLNELDSIQKAEIKIRQELISIEFAQAIQKTQLIKGISVLAEVLTNANADTLRQMTDRFKEKYHSGVVVLGSVYELRPVMVAAVTEDLVPRGIHAGEILKVAAKSIDGSGGGRPTLAQAGGKDATRLPEAIISAFQYVEKNLT